MQGKKTDHSLCKDCLCEPVTEPWTPTNLPLRTGGYCLRCWEKLVKYRYEVVAFNRYGTPVSSHFSLTRNQFIKKQTPEASKVVKGRAAWG